MCSSDLPSRPEGQKLMETWDKGDGVLGGIGNVARQVKSDYDEAKGFIPGMKAVGRDLRAMGEGIVEQVPNMIAPTVGMVGGALSARGQRFHHRLVPGLGLQHVGHQVAVQQHRALAHAGGAAGVLQHGDVVAVDRRFDEVRLPPSCQGLFEFDGIRQLVVGHHFFHVAHHEVPRHLWANSACHPWHTSQRA